MSVPSTMDHLRDAALLPSANRIHQGGDRHFPANVFGSYFADSKTTKKLFAQPYSHLDCERKQPNSVAAHIYHGGHSQQRHGAVVPSPNNLAYESSARRPQNDLVQESAEHRRAYAGGEGYGLRLHAMGVDPGYAMLRQDESYRLCLTFLPLGRSFALLNF